MLRFVRNDIDGASPLRESKSEAAAHPKVKNEPLEGVQCLPRPAKSDRSTSHCDDDFSLGVSFAKIPERFSNLAQRVTSIDNGDDLAGFEQLHH